MASTKPSILLVHGAWQGAAQYKDLKRELVNDGYMVLTPENATSGSIESDIIGKTHMDDVARIHEALSGPLAEGKDVVLVAHSYGGVPGSAAVEGYQVFERQAKGLPGGIKHVVYLAAFALPQRGASVLAGLGGQYAHFMSRKVSTCIGPASSFKYKRCSHQTYKLTRPKGDVVYLNESAKDALFNDVDSATAMECFEESVGQSAASLETPVAFAAPDVSVPKTYIACEHDHALPLEVQLQLAAALGKNARVVKVKSGHAVHRNAKALPEVIAAIERAALL